MRRLFAGMCDGRAANRRRHRAWLKSPPHYERGNTKKQTTTTIMTEQITVSIDNLYDVRDRIVSLLKGKSYTTTMVRSRGTDISPEQSLERDNNGVYAFELCFTEKPEGRIQVSDSWGVYSIHTGDRVTFGENQLAVEGVCSDGELKNWTFAIEPNNQR